MYWEGSRYAGDEWVTEVVAACRIALGGEVSGTQGLKGGKYLKYGYTGYFTSRSRARQVSQDSCVCCVTGLRGLVKLEIAQL